ncbi:TPA: hypothetical protein U0688_001353 [Streptococcus suis]|uniref:Uncharacterized protein n=2 Tax=Streptococcus suis TaxID=1307 RepID=A0A0Z8ESJ7_STRSU|nr:hypothetical protein [Streptococcus suis]ANM47565.1 hypothetical protein [Streptococcus phage phiZJ20091101-3]QBX30916.1 hypothetical protein Javan580_0002 [Streptococcus phage Javan580]AKH11086.1 hypothetical protein HAS68_1327 [Streptococcus suis 05HAS68]ALA28555.1 hypothetical protein AA105_04660 [Streptococcus suis]AMU80273.1 hypothetical protein AN924_18500 [Streptococcus suis]
MNKRTKKKYKPFKELWDCMEWVMFRLNRHVTRLDSLENRLENMRVIDSANIQTINRKFEEYEKRVETLEREVKQLKKPWYKRRK